MQMPSERRDPRTVRIPTDRVFVELASTEARIEADAIDLGQGGLAARASVLPPIGAVFQCRIQSDDGEIDADAEVVWARGTGPNTGEFGMRFVGLDEYEAQQIASWVEGFTDDTAAPLETVSLRLANVSTPLDADVVHRADDVLVVEQSLPFFRIGTPVSTAGLSGHIECADLRVEDNIPRLVLTIAVDGESAIASTVTSKTTPLAVSKASARTVEEDPDTLVDAPVSTKSSVASMEGGRTRAETDVPRIVYSSSKDSRVEAPQASALVEGMRRVQPWLDAAARWLRSASASVRAMFLLVVRRGVIAIASAKREAGPLFSKALLQLQGLRSSRKSSVPRKAAPQAVRRTTARTERAHEQVAVAATKPGFRPGWLVLAAVAFVVLMLGWRALRADAASVVVAAEKALPVEAAAIEPAQPEQVAVPIEVADPGGLIPEPSFPTLQGATRPQSPPGVAPQGSPYAAETGVPVQAPASRSASFGNPGTVGEEFQLRMQTPVASMQGERTSDGFVVTIPGNTALEGARRISSIISTVDRASIVNADGNAVLTIRFSAGATPQYFVGSRGDMLVIRIAN